MGVFRVSILTYHEQGNRKVFPAGRPGCAQHRAHERRADSGYEHDADEPPNGHRAGGVRQRQQAAARLGRVLLAAIV